MLTLLLLAAAPQSTMPVMPDPASVLAPQPDAARMRVIGQSPGLCRSEVLRANDPVTPNAGLMWREGGEAVGLYRLLDRRVNGCPAPIVVNYRVPGSNALGREMQPVTPEQPVMTRRP